MAKKNKKDVLGGNPLSSAYRYVYSAYSDNHHIKILLLLLLFSDEFVKTNPGISKRSEIEKAVWLKDFSRYCSSLDYSPITVEKLKHKYPTVIAKLRIIYKNNADIMVSNLIKIIDYLNTCFKGYVDVTFRPGFQVYIKSLAKQDTDAEKEAVHELYTETITKFRKKIKDYISIILLEDVKDNDQLNDKNIFLNDIVLIAMNMSLLAKLAHYNGDIPSSLIPPPWEGGGKKLPKKEILGKTKSIHKIPGDRKEYVKHKGKLITIKDYKELMKKKK